MSPRRMDISALLRDPSPDPPRPRTLDALLHPRPPLFSPPAPTRPPFLGLDALVHVASEERRRIADRDAERDLAAHLDGDAPPARPHDHDWLARLASPHPALSHRHPDFSSPFHDSSTPHMHVRDPVPQSPSPDARFSHLPSPSTRLPSSASPTNNYPTLRQHLEPTLSPTRSALLSATDTRPVHSSPFVHALHPLQLPSYPTPRNTSPHRLSPQHFRSQHHSSPVSAPSLRSTSAERDTMSPRYNHGPRMAGGIQIFSNDPASVRDASRPDVSNYHSPGRDTFSERFVSESRIDARHDQPRLSPFSARTISADYQTHPSQDQEFPRERLRSCPSHLPLYSPADNGQTTTASVMEPDLSGHPLPERHPIRVWEEQPTLTRRVSPARTPSVAAEGRPWPETNKSEHVEWPTRQARRTEQRRDAENVPIPPLSTNRVPLVPVPEHSSSHTLSKGIVSPILLQPRLPSPSHPRAHLPQTSLLNSRIPPSLVANLHPGDFETNSGYQPKSLDAPVKANTGTSFMHAGMDATQPFLGKMDQTPGAMDVDIQPVPTQDLVPESLEMPPATVSQSMCKSPSQQPSSKGDVPPEDEPISSLIPSEAPSRRSSGPENTSERESGTSERTMMDVDEELLSLVEDRPVRAITAPLSIQSVSQSPLPTTATRDTGAGVEQGSSEASCSQPVFRVPLVIDEEKDRASMPPPAARNKKAEKDKAVRLATGGKKKKEGLSKPTPKQKQPSKPRPKAAPKPRVKPNVVDSSLRASIPKDAVNADARSRSASVIPGTVDDTIPEPDVENSDKEDDKLYCVCKTRYDEDRMMIACDRCDEWFHTLCVNMPDLEIDLVDQFICPPCIQKHPHLRTTWKRRCLYGLRHEVPSSPEACHKPSRGAFSKYCSDNCGIKYMQAHIAQWEKSGGARNLLWESVKNAPKREGVVVSIKANSPPRVMAVDDNDSVPNPLDAAAKRRAEREVACLNSRLDEVVKEREFMKHELDMVMWREKVVKLASERAGKVDECGWDQRLCFGEEEWTDFGAEVLESYEEIRIKMESGDDAMLVDAIPSMHGEWWCTGKIKCGRHAGWQKLRAAEVSFDKETKEGILLKLTAREREIRKCIEDILYPQPTGILQTPFKPPHPEIQPNGLEKPYPRSVLEKSYHS